jgi:predicted nucleic acid-binding protein
LGSLIDSSIFIAAERGDEGVKSALARLAPTEGEVYISAVTVFELLHGVHRATSERRTAREAYVENALQLSRCCRSMNPPPGSSQASTRRPRLRVAMTS